MPTDNGPDRDVSPSKNDFPTSKHGEEFNEAMNPPNNPTKNHRPTHFNVTYDYCDHDKESIDY